MNNFYSKTGEGTRELADYFSKSSVLFQLDFDLDGYWNGPKSKDDIVFNWHVIEKGKKSSEEGYNLYRGKALVREKKVVSVDVYTINEGRLENGVSSSANQDDLNKAISNNIERLL